MRSLGALQAHLASTGLADVTVLADILIPGAPQYRSKRPTSDEGWDGTYAGNAYTHDWFVFSELEQGVEGQRPSFTFTIQNVVDANGQQLPWSNELNATGTELNGVEVVLRLVKLSLLVAGDETSVLEEARWYINGGSLEGTVLKARCAPPADALSWETLVFSIASDTCGWNYKQGPCRSQSELPDCPKTLAACIARYPNGSALDFGPGFPLFQKNTRRRAGA